MSAPGLPSFERDIRPLFRLRDREAMRSKFDLWSYDEVRGHANAIYEQIAKGTMPCDGRWPDEQVTRLHSWIDAGMLP